MRHTYVEASQLEDAAARKELARWAMKSEGKARLEATLTLAATEEEVVAASSDLDADPYLFNAENGTIDLRLGELREHRRADLLTKLAPVAFDPDARDYAFDSFIEQTMGGDQEMVGFLRRAAGYTLTGDTGEEVLFFAHGPEATGKSTFLEAFKAALGDYQATADFETFSPSATTRGPAQTSPA